MSLVSISFFSLPSLISYLDKLEDRRMIAKNRQKRNKEILAELRSESLLAAEITILKIVIKII
jgi:hypothetical protein